MLCVWYFIVCAVFRFTDVPEEQDVNVADDIHEEKIYDDLCSLKAKAGSQVPHSQSQAHECIFVVVWLANGHFL